MSAIHQLIGTIESLDSMHLETQKRQLLVLVESLADTNEPRPDTAEDRRHKRLSPRERQIMSMILEGQRLKEIAMKLDISVKTVTTHRSRLLRKLGLEDNLGLYRYGVRNGLISV
jgi:DNA-binding NarL/FixJ family response regulator